MLRCLYKLQEIISKGCYRLFRESCIKASLGGCGEKVHIASGCNIKGIENIHIGAFSSIGPGATLWTTRAKIMIGNKVIVGPNLTIITGDHRTNLIGKYMADVTDAEKRPEDDINVTICDDVWIGANVTILKGVTVSQGCVIAAGSVVTKDTEPYGIYAGVPAVRRKERFSEQDLRKHIEELNG